MNIEQIKKNIGKQFRLRPRAERWDVDRQLPSEDDPWVLASINNKHVQLTNTRTGHTVELGHDNVREFRTPDFLLLRCTIRLHPVGLDIEPIIQTSTILTEDQERLLGIIAKYQREFKVPKLTVPRDGAGLFRPEKGIRVQVERVNIALELFGDQKPETHRRVEFELVMDSMPSEYLKRIPESIYGSPFVVSVTSAGFKYLGLPES